MECNRPGRRFPKITIHLTEKGNAQGGGRETDTKDNGSCIGTKKGPLQKAQHATGRRLN